MPKNTDEETIITLPIPEKGKRIRINSQGWIPEAEVKDLLIKARIKELNVFDFQDYEGDINPTKARDYINNRIAELKAELGEESDE